MPILFQFDVRTVALFVALTFLVQGTAIGAQAYLIKDFRKYRGVDTALIANLCVAVGLLLRLFAGWLPDFIPFILASTLILAGPGLFYAALSQFTDQPYSKMAVALIIAFVMALLSYYTYWDDDMGMRMIILSLGAAAIIFILVYQLWRTRQTSLRFSADLMLGSFLIYGLFMVFRTVTIAMRPPEDLFSDSPVQSATYLLLFVISFFWSTGFILMISQRLRNDMMELATIDALTRIPNRGTTQIFLDKELGRAQRNNTEFAVLLIDIDDFKQVNDRWGHAMGDKVLIRTASILKTALRKQDLVGRWGGEEFLVVVPGSPRCDTGALAERLRNEVASAQYTHPNGTFCITVSIGTACASQEDRIDQILKTADKALYRAKRTKNTVRVGKKQTA